MQPVATATVGKSGGKPCSAASVANASYRIRPQAGTSAGTASRRTIERSAPAPAAGSFAAGPVDAGGDGARTVALTP